MHGATIKMKNKLFWCWSQAKEAEDAAPLRYDAALSSNLIPTFRGKTLASSSGVEIPYKMSK